MKSLDQFTDDCFWSKGLEAILMNAVDLSKYTQLSKLRHFTMIMLSLR
ncbi:hypothetical protein LNL84_12190 [Vibrio sp. ZSDZ34]|uniref:Uncharacterized protein n=1 Tax=Vibrio gelatinilyticus TaxID=2893468 RepID=A0A9X2AZB7_9VIBR|nr:hypothetical protein [Vibrio gelatinilyticus]MCJ2377592.1 hypothetical protein [Vibrio gelatinilyticus]